MRWQGGAKASFPGRYPSSDAHRIRWLSHQNSIQHRKKQDSYLGLSDFKACVPNHYSKLSLATLSTFCDLIRMVICMMPSSALYCPPWFDLTLALATFTICQSQLVHFSPPPKGKIPHHSSQQLICSVLNWWTRSRPITQVTEEDVLIFLASSGCLWVPLGSVLPPAQNLTNQYFFTLAARSLIPNSCVVWPHFSSYLRVCYVSAASKNCRGQEKLYLVLPLCPPGLDTQPPNNIKLIW